MLLQAQSHTVQARSVATRALQPVARSALSSSVLKVHTAQASLLPHHAGSSVSSSSHSSRCSSSWSPRAAVTTSAAAEAAAAATAEQQAAVEGEWSVLNFYHLVDIADPDEMLARHKQYIADHDLHSVCGRIYISKQGINCQGGGLKTHTQQYVSWVASQPEFQGLFHTLWPADGPMFPKLRLKLKPSLISLAGEHMMHGPSNSQCIVVLVALNGVVSGMDTASAMSTAQQSCRCNGQWGLKSWSGLTGCTAAKV
eukprot:GHUV01048602.1.p1 GENE.GHUV01048602.1~~GHUV01048602.1.p1  ORF type:complete len:255 (+),score=82.60 GHUV01048602.1:611-1375(+)